MERDGNLTQLPGPFKFFSRRLPSLPAAGSRLLCLRARTVRWTGRIGDACLDLLAPRTCRQCGGAVASGENAFCEGCLGSIQWIGTACARCGMPVLNPAPVVPVVPVSVSPVRGASIHPGAEPALPPRCGVCAPLRFRFDLAAAGGRHTAVLRTAVLRYKFHADRGVLPLLRRALLRAAQSEGVREAVRQAGLVIPVPLHPLKRLWRGWDPAQELALGLGAELRAAGILLCEPPVLPLLQKNRWTPSQVSLKEAARRRNLRGAFRVRGGRAVPSTVILVDDVLTTGTTASECARALKRKGARTVVVLAVARSG